MFFLEKTGFPMFFDGGPQNSCRGSSFFGGISENRILVVHSWVVFKNRCIQKTLVLQWFLHVSHFERRR